MKSLHDFLVSELPAYRRWHDHVASTPTHWVTFLVACALVTTNFLYAVQSYAQVVDKSSTTSPETIIPTEIETEIPIVAPDLETASTTQVVIPVSTTTIDVITDVVTTEHTSFVGEESTSTEVSSSSPVVTTTGIVSVTEDRVLVTPGAIGVTVFSLKRIVVNSLSIPVIELKTTDDSNVVGYMITESPSKPLDSDPRWKAEKPVVYTVIKGGTKTLYLWIRDLQGNIIAGPSAKSTVMLITK